MSGPYSCQTRYVFTAYSTKSSPVAFDFPHFRSIGLDAQSALHALVGSLPREGQEKVVGGNAVMVFNLD